MVAVSTTAVTQFSLAGASQWSVPLVSAITSSALAPDGSTWIADAAHDRITRVATGGGSPESWVPLGTTLNQPSAVAFDPRGNVGVATADGLIVLSPSGSIVRPLRRLGGAYVRSLALTPTAVYFVANNLVERVDLASSRVSVVGTFGQGLRQPGDVGGIALASDGTIWVADTDGGRVVRIDADGRTQVACDPALLPSGVGPTDVALAGQTLFATNGVGIVGYPTSTCVPDARVTAINLAKNPRLPRPARGARTVRVRVRVSLSSGARSAVVVGWATSKRRLTGACVRGGSIAGRCSTRALHGTTGRSLTTTVAVAVPSHWRGECRSLVADTIASNGLPGDSVTRRVCWPRT